MIPPIAVSLWYQDDSPMPFIIAFLLTFFTGLFIWWPFRNTTNKDLKTREGFFIVALFWSVICLYGALPFMLSAAPHESLTDAVFESVSGFTTTGSTVTNGVDFLPHAIRYYRQQLQLIGGMGIIVLAVAILPMLGIGGMQLYRAETPGPVKDSKLTPRITETAKTLWLIYVGLIVLCCLSYWAAGMTLFEAIGESFATVATGGFSMHDSSFAYYDNPLIEVIAVVFMLLGSINFALHFVAVREGTFKHYLKDVETKTFLMMMFVSSIIALTFLLVSAYFPDPLRSVTKVIFNVISIATTTGYLAAPVAAWPLFLPYFVFILAMIGGCGGSTSGGIKTMRMMLLHKQGAREMNRLIHPNAVIPIKFGEHVLPNHILEATWGFVSIYLGLFILLFLLLMASGLDISTAFGSLVACFANSGQGLGDTANNFSGLDMFSKWLLIFAMLLGRLEIFSILILFTPGFWRK